MVLMNYSQLTVRSILVLTCFGATGILPGLAQTDRRPTRADPPVFQPGQFDRVFFKDAKSMLQGELPLTSATEGTSSVATQVAPGPAVTPDASDPRAWQNLIVPASLEDLVKGSKLRLDQIVTTQPAFVGGGFAPARKEFSLLAVLFAVIENHPAEVRWKSSAAAGRELFARVAANTKIGTLPVYQEAKNRMLDLNDLMSGSKLAQQATTETDWANLIDRVPLMQLLEWANQEHVTTYSASQTAFDKDKEALRRYAELIAVLGKVAIAEEMADADDDDYRAFAIEMIDSAQQIALAVGTDNAELARQASSRLGQSCSNCHDNFR